jgi:hypothetical protein
VTKQEQEPHLAIRQSPVHHDSSPTPNVHTQCGILTETRCIVRIQWTSLAPPPPRLVKSNATPAQTPLALGCGYLFLAVLILVLRSFIYSDEITIIDGALKAITGTRIRSERKAEAELWIFALPLLGIINYY